MTILDALLIVLPPLAALVAAAVGKVQQFLICEFSSLTRKARHRIRPCTSGRAVSLVLINTRPDLRLDKVSVRRIASYRLFHRPIDFISVFINPTC